jgi:hypothetical protein
MDDIAGMITGIIITSACMAALVLSLYYYFSARNKERMAMIEKGIYKFEAPKKSPLRGLKIGLFFTGIGVGIFFGHLLETYTTVDEVASYFSMILLFGGFSFILGYIIEIRQNKADK